GKGQLSQGKRCSSRSFKCCRMDGSGPETFTQEYVGLHNERDTRTKGTSPALEIPMKTLILILSSLSIGCATKVITAPSTQSLQYNLSHASAHVEQAKTLAE